MWHISSPERRVSDLVDLDRYLRERVAVANASGGRGYEAGVRTFDCPLCGDRRARGWVHVLGFVAGCLNAGCDAEPRLAGGAVEWVRRVEGLKSRGEAWSLLHREYPRVGPPLPVVSEPEVEDFCRMPEVVPFGHGVGALGRVRAEAVAFARRQWGLEEADLARWGAGYCLRGRYAWRVVVPVVMGGRQVSFVARTFRRGEPRYLVARHDGDRPECGRPASGLLFNADALAPSGEAVLVEGAGDVMAWAKRGDGRPAVALLGQALTPQKLALLAARALSGVVVALDDEPDARRRAADHAADLCAWGVPAAVGRWVGGKDAGSGAELSAPASTAARFAELVRQRVAQ